MQELAFGEICNQILRRSAWHFCLAPVQFPTGEKINLGEASLKARNPDRSANSKF
ncbi:hypothetical protein QUB68_09480 [Microcoleus sp. A006_D1]|uniref:hypothetical protein n=1 Tax=Microcoleus sp. A006_D1 TaxID=3055267 RepID=UPI002FCF9644